MLVSAAQRSESTIRIHTSPPTWASLPPRLHPIHLDHHRALSWTAACPVLCSRLQLSASYIVVYICQCYSPILSHCPLPHCVHMSVLSVCVSIPVLQIGSPVPFFQIPHICINTQYLPFSFFLTSLCMKVSRSIYISTNDPRLFLLMAE